MHVPVWGGSATYVMKRQRTKSALKTSFLQITTLCLLMVMTVQNGSFVPLARNHTTLNVLLLKLSNTFKPKDDHLLAPSMSVKVQKVPRVKRVNPLHPPHLTRSVKWVTKRVTYGELVLLSYTMKKKFSKKGKGGKVHQTPEEKRDAMSHKNKRNQQWKEEKMEEAKQLWEANKDKPPKERLSMRAIASQLKLLKTTVIERLSGRRKGEGHIAGGNRKARVLTDGKSGSSRSK